MTEEQFIALAVSEFSNGEIVVVSGPNPLLTNDLLCRAKTAIAAASKTAMVLDASTVVGYPRDVFAGSAFWQPRTYYFKGDYVFPSSYVDDNVLFAHPFNCASTILARFRYQCVTQGQSGNLEPPWPMETGDTVDDYAAGWITRELFFEGLTWEMIYLQAKGNFVVLAHNEFDPDGPRRMTGDLVNDLMLDLFNTFRPMDRMGNKATLTRDIFPYMSRVYYHASEEVTFVKTQSPDR